MPLSSVGHTTKRKTNTSKTKKSDSILRENGGEAAKIINLSLRTLKMFSCTTFKKQSDVALMSQVKKKPKPAKCRHIKIKHFSITSRSNKAEKMVETKTVKDQIVAH